MFKIIAISADIKTLLGFNLYHGNSFSHLQSKTIITKKKERYIPFGQHLLFVVPFYMYILSGTHMHAPEYRMGVIYPIVMISLCIIYYVHPGLYSTIYSISAVIFMQEESKRTP